MWPQRAQRRRWNHHPPVCRHSMQPTPLGGTAGSIWLAVMTAPSHLNLPPGRPRRNSRIGSYRVADRNAGRLQTVNDQPHRHRPLADGGRHAFDRTAPYVADAEDAGPTRLEGQGHEIGILKSDHWDVCAGEQEAMIVDGELPVQPLGAGRGADEDEETTAGLGETPTRCVVAQRDTFEPPLTEQADDLGVWRNGDPGITLDLVDQVPRHRTGE